jgi:acyl-CoA thioesterase-1
VRRLQKLSCLAAVLLLFASFHPTQSSASGPPAVSARTVAKTATPAPSRDGLPIIVAFGDSLTAGYGVGPGKSYPDCLQRDLDADGYHYRIVNLGVIGDTSKDGLARIKDVLAQRPVLTIVAIGGNDGLRGIPVSEMSSNLDAILGTLKRSGTKIVIGGITLPPNYGVNYVKVFNAVYPTLAAKYQVPLLPFMLDGVWNHPDLMQKDGIHPTAPGNEIVARKFLPLIEPLLKKR